MEEIKLQGKHTEEDFFKMYKKCKDVRLRERYQAMYLSFSFSWKIIARIVGRKYKTILAWAKAYNEHGIEGLESDKPTGRSSRLTDEQLGEVKNTVRMSPRSIGLKFSNWTCKNLVWWINKTFHVRFCKEAVRQILHKLGFVLIKPAYKYVLADKLERKRFLRRFRRRISRLTNNDLLMFLDEAAVKQHSNLQPKWVLKGSKEYVETFGNHAKVNVLGAICHTIGKTFHMKSKKLNSDIFMKFVNHLITCNPGKHLVIVVDNAPWHTSQKVAKFLENVKNVVEVLWLPAYSPDFNPIEHLWKFMKSVIANFFFATMKELKNALTEFFKGLFHKKEKIMSLCSADYLLG